MMQEGQRKGLLLTLLVLTTALMTMSNDLYAPSIPHLPEYFGTRAELVKLTISLWTMAYGGLLLVYGPLSERFGRRPILVIAMVVFTLASYACSIATTIEQIIVARVLQGAAAGAEGVLVLSIVRDSFDDKGQVKAFSIYRGASALPPIFAPILGVYVFLTFGWQANFVLLGTVAALVTALLWKFLPESNRADGTYTPLRAIISNYITLVTSFRFVSLAVIMSTSIAYLVIFSTAVPFVLVNVLKLSPEVFPYFQAVTMVALILGNVAANRLANRMTIERLLFTGILIVVAGGALLGFVVFATDFNLYLLGLPLVVIAFGNAPILATVPTLAMNATPAPTGAGAAMLLTFTSLLASTTAVVEGTINDGTAGSLAIMLGFVGILALVTFMLGVRFSKE